MICLRKILPEQQITIQHIIHLKLSTKQNSVTQK